MNKINNGTAEYEILQNRFTSFICKSMNNARINYLKHESVRIHHTFEMEDEKFAFIPDCSDFVSGLCDTDSLSYALKQIDKRERFVIISRVLEEKSFEDIADKLGLGLRGSRRFLDRYALNHLRNRSGRDFRDMLFHDWLNNGLQVRFFYNRFYRWFGFNLFLNQ